MQELERNAYAQNIQNAAADEHLTLAKGDFWINLSVVARSTWPYVEKLLMKATGQEQPLKPVD